MTWPTFFLILIVALAIFAIPSVRIVTFSILAAAADLLRGLLLQIGGNAPLWLTKAANWTAAQTRRTGQGAGRIIGIIGWILIVATALVSIGVYFEIPMLVVAVLVPLAVLVYLLFRGVDIVSRIFSAFGIKVDLGIAQILQAWSIVLVLIAILSLAFAGSELFSAEHKMLIRLTVLLLAFSASVAGAKLTPARKIIMWGVPLLVAAVIVPELIKWNNPVLSAIKEVGVATSKRTQTSTLKLADTIEPEADPDLVKLNREFRKKVLQEDLKRHEAILAELKLKVEKQGLSDEEIEKVRQSTQKIMQLQRELKELETEENQDRSSQGPSKGLLPFDFSKPNLSNIDLHKISILGGIGILVLICIVLATKTRRFWPAFFAAVLGGLFMLTLSSFEKPPSPNPQAGQAEIINKETEATPTPTFVNARNPSSFSPQESAQKAPPISFSRLSVGTAMVWTPILLIAGVCVILAIKNKSLIPLIAAAVLVGGFWLLVWRTFEKVANTYQTIFSITSQ